jgi:RNA polymerase sigma-70 factor (ECF subfamily)
MGAQTGAVHPGPAADSLADEDLATGLVAGDENCLAAMYHRWSPLVHSLARRSLGDAKEAEDVTQEVFLGVWRGRRGFRPERGTVGGWIVGITRRGIADALSARTRRLHLVAAAGPSLVLAEPAARKPRRPSIASSSCTSRPDCPRPNSGSCG